MLKKGAMFGLDARIALSIFGTLAIVTSAALLSTIERSAVSDLVNEANVVHQAYQSYEYDLGDYVEESSTALLKSSELLTSSKANWAGPYLTNKQADAPNADTQLVSNVGQYSILRAKDRAATAETDTPFVACASSQACYLWLLFNDDEVSDKVIKTLDITLDDDDGYLAGRVQKYSGRLLLRSKRVES
jgi:hypothetical protein